MATKNFDSGRSMVETIGVLAVMGVLTIGGIAGYNYGINKHRANQVLQDIRLIYQETKYPNSVRQILETEEFPDMELDTQSPYEYSFTFPSLDDFIYDSTSETEPNLISVNVSGVSKTACDILLKTKPEYVLMLKANGQSVWSCDKDENELSYIFEITADSLDYGTCSVCTGEHCFDDDLNCPEGETCQNDVCSKCKVGYAENKYGDCFTCDFNWTYWHTEEGCKRCNAIYGYDSYQGGGVCAECSHINMEVSQEVCKTCMDKDPDVVWLGNPETNKGLCTNCKNRFSFTTNQGKNTQEQCQKCAEIVGNGQVVWYPDVIGDTLGKCARCDRKEGQTINEDKTACICPKGEFWTFNTDGGNAFCVECTNSKNYIASKIECDKCQERYFTGTNERKGYCKLCTSGQVKSADGKSCVDA